MKKIFFPVALASLLLVATAGAQEVKTRLGTLTFEYGFPTAETTTKVFDEIDFQRAIQSYMWAYPVVSFEAIRIATMKDYGLDYNDFGIADQFVDPRSVFLTANNTTVYAYTNIDLARSGPMVIEVPPGPIVGIIDDFWQRSVTDVGLPGPDGDKGGKFLILPPGYDGQVPQTGYHILKATMNNYNVMVRGLVTNLDSDVPNAVLRVKQMKVYPLSESNPKPNKFFSISGKAIETLPPGGLEYWKLLSDVINNNPVEERDRFFMAMLKPLGIEKGKTFQPDARQRAILEEASVLGDAIGRTMLYEGEQRISGANTFAGTHWNWVVLVDPKQESANYSQLDERLHYVYGAIYTSPFIGTKKAGAGSTYTQTFMDKDGKRMEGSKSYRLHVPANVPAANFWSVTLYSADSRSMIQNPRNNSAHSSYDNLKKNAEGSIDLYFGPKAPAGLESNWIETVPGKGFYPMFRFYGPKASLFDGTWKLPDVELVN